MVALRLRPLVAASVLAASTLMLAPAHAAGVESLSCIEEMFDNDRAIAMADIGSADEARSAAAQKKVDFMMLGMGSRMCARRMGWSDNQYFVSIGYILAWPTMRGLQLQGADKGFAAIDRAWAAHEQAWIGHKRLADGEVDTLLAEARADGLLVPAGDPAERDARRYADVLHQLAGMRADFAANRKPRGLND